MPRFTKPLTNTEIDRAKPKDKKYKLTDGDGLFLLVKPNGSKLWCFNYYRPNSTARIELGLGSYPEISLADARRKREEYRSLVAKGIDPQIHRELQKEESSKALENSLLAVAERWKINYQLEVQPLTLKKNWKRLNKYVFSKIGNLPIESISPSLLIKTLNPMYLEGKNDTLFKILRLLNNILRFAVNNECCRSRNLGNATT